MRCCGDVIPLHFCILHQDDRVMMSERMQSHNDHRRKSFCRLLIHISAGNHFTLFPSAPNDESPDGVKNDDHRCNHAHDGGDHHDWPEIMDKHTREET